MRRGKKEGKIIKSIISHPNIKNVSSSIPSSILQSPSSLLDISVKRGKGRSDDDLYDEKEFLRNYIPRGLVILEQNGGNNNDSDDENRKVRMVLNGLGKFTGHEDNDSDASNSSSDSTRLSKYFTASIQATSFMIVTEKANGESGHVSMIELLVGGGGGDGNEEMKGGEKDVRRREVMVIVGSKSVHLLLRLTHLSQDIEEYESRNEERFHSFIVFFLYHHSYYILHIIN